MFCKHCHHEFYVPSEMLGKKMRCPNCTGTLYIDDAQMICSCSQCGGMLEVSSWMLGSLSECPHCQREIKLSLGEDSSKYFPDSPKRTAMLKTASLKSGDIIGSYCIIRCLGIGGMGEVYLAEHTLLKNRCALKLLKKHIVKDDLEIRKRMIREARIAKNIQHPNLIAVQDAVLDESSDSCYIIMEYVDGVSIESILAEGPMLEKRALEIVYEVAKALKIAADYGVTHRDIKPANIMLSVDGAVKLADLGIAKVDGDSKQSMTLTNEAAVLGTPNYASPEQLRSSHQVDCRADIYSLGATLYHMLTGKRPFEAESVFGVMANVLEKSLPMTNEVNPEITVKTSELIARMMAKERDERPADFEILLNELTSVKKQSFWRKLKFPKLPAKLLWIGGAAIAAVISLCIVGTVIYKKLSALPREAKSIVAETPAVEESQKNPEKNVADAPGTALPKEIKMPEDDNFKFSADGKVLKKCTNNNIEKAIIPAGVTAVGRRAFANCWNLTEVVVPEGVTVIGESSFADCPKLKKIDLPGSLTTISRRAFSGCSELDVVLPKNVQTIQTCAFDSVNSVQLVQENRHFIMDENGVILDAQKSRIIFVDKNITRYTVPESVKIIEERNFADRLSLRSIKLPSGLVKIGKQAFAGSDSLTEMVIPDSVKEIGFNIFQDCRSLKRVEIPSNLKKLIVRSIPENCVIDIRLKTAGREDFELSRDGKTLIKILKKDVEVAIIPDGVRIINSGAFENCVDLTEVVLPKGVTEIGVGAFTGCRKLKTIKYR